MSSFQGRQQPPRYSGPGGSPASSPPNTVRHDGARRNHPSPRARWTPGLASSPPNQNFLLHETLSGDGSGLARRGTPAGSFPYFCGWDSLTVGAHSLSTHTQNVLLVGSEGCLDVYIATEAKLKHYCRLEDLPGAVIDAKIVPTRGEPSAAPTKDLEPVVVLTVHGPLLSSDGLNEHIGHGEIEESITCYQTSVEVYSLRTANHIGTLFRTQPVDLEEPLGSKRFVQPPAQGDLRIEVRGQFVTIASGISGEVFVFHYDYEALRRAGMSFRCLAKLWTSTETVNPSSITNELNSPTNYSSKSIFSLSFRWLALVPPISASSINGEVPLVSEQQVKPPSFKTFLAPERPVEDCIIDAPDADTLLDRASKYVVKNSKALGEKGKEAWNNYWSPPQQSPGFSSPVYPLDMGFPLTEPFPPTHGIDSTRSSLNTEPALVAIYDLDRLIENPGVEPRQHPTKPLATFPAPLGCSFLSFSPDGRYLMTISDKGEYQFVWHCFAVVNTEASWSSHPNHERVLTEVARFSRNTEASIIDVSWQNPYGEVVAMLTAKGTVHLHPLPPEATTWPLKPRAYSSKMISEDDGGSDRPHSNDWASTAMSSAKMAFGSLSSVARRRSGSGSPKAQPTSLYSSIGSTIGSVANSSSRYVAKGVTSGYGFASDKLAYIRHAGDNKIHLPPSHLVRFAPRRIQFFGSAHSGSISVIEEGRFSVYPYKIQQLPSSRKGVPPQHFAAIETRSPPRCNIPPLPDVLFPPVFAAVLKDPATRTDYGGLESDEGGNEEFGERRPSIAKPRARLDQTAIVSGFHPHYREDEWRAAAEMTSIAKKIPIYRQPQVRFFVFEEGSRADGGVSDLHKDEEDFELDRMEDGGERWVFGGSLGRRRRVRAGRNASAVNVGERADKHEEDEWEEIR